MAPTDALPERGVLGDREARHSKWLTSVFFVGLTMAVAAAGLCVMSMIDVRDRVEGINRAMRADHQAVAVIDQVSTSLVAFTATTIDDLSVDERREVLAKTEAAWKELQHLLTDFQGHLSVLPADHLVIFDKSLRSVTHSWQELRDNLFSAMLPAEKAYHFLRILEDLDAVRGGLTLLRQTAAEAAMTETNNAFGALRQSVSMIGAIIIICVLVMAFGAIMARHYLDRARRTNAILLRTNAALHDAKRAAEEASRTKSEFLMTFSHELRTPLNAIIGFSELLRTKPVRTAITVDDKEYFEEINAGGLHLLNLINDILDFSKAGAGQLQICESAFRSSRIMTQVVSMFRARCVEHHLTLKLDVAEAPVILGDERRVKQIVLNLLSNAVKFTSAGGTITVGAYLDGDAPVLYVRDSGIGIAAEDIPRVMERFGQVDSSMSRRYEGTGLGLPLVVAMMELHGGRVELESTPGKGTTVRVIFPPDRLVTTDQKVPAIAA